MINSRPSIYINDLSAKIHAQNVAVGWWDNKDRCIYEVLQLCISEVSEATEGVRKDLMDNHLEHRLMEEVEFADCAIRLMDFAGFTGTKYVGVYIHDRLVNCKTKIGQHAGISRAICKIIDCYEVGNELHFDYSRAMNTIINICAQRGYDLWATIEEKLEYNKNRPDHKRENRAKPGGKKA